MIDRQRRRWLQYSLVLPGLASSARAQTTRGRFPARDIQIVVPAEPGGGIDTMARLLAKGMAAVMAQPVVVINRSGGGGTLGAGSVARAEPDGHTLLVNGVGHLVAPMLYADASFDPVKDFTPLARFGIAPNVLVVHESLKDLTLAQLIRDARSRSAGFAYASAGYGNTSHLAAELFMSRTDTRWLHVPYRGTGPAVRALLAGEVQLMFVPAGSVATALGTGRAHALAVAHRQRLPQLPGIHTLAEFGVHDADFSQWYGLFAPAGVAAAIADQLADTATQVFRDSAVLHQLGSLGIEPAVLGRNDFTRLVASESQRLASIISKENIRNSVN